jgi:hypothetical protein
MALRTIEAAPLHRSIADNDVRGFPYAVAHILVGRPNRSSARFLPLDSNTSRSALFLNSPSKAVRYIASTLFSVLHAHFIDLLS